jgi:hypothetical protein
MKNKKYSDLMIELNYKINKLKEEIIKKIDDFFYISIKVVVVASIFSNFLATCLAIF